MLKWILIIGLAILVIGSLVLGGILELAGGLLELIIFVGAALVLGIVFAVWRAKSKSGSSNTLQR